MPRSIKQPYSGPSWLTDSIHQPLLCNGQLYDVQPKRKDCQCSKKASEEAKSYALSVLAIYRGQYMRAAEALIGECPLLYQP